MNIKSKITGILFALAVAAVVFYISISSNADRNFSIDLIELEGNSYFTKEQYLDYAHLTNQSGYKQLSLPLIKDRIEKHPYIKTASVKYDGNNKVLIKIIEKEFESILFSADKQHLITKELELVPLLPLAGNINYPVIVNLPAAEEIKNFSSVKKNKAIIAALKIITAVKFVNPELYSALSEIDLNNGTESVMMFSKPDYQIRLGNENAVRKVAYFNSLWKHLKGKEVNSIINYIDMRYAGHIFMGIKTDNRNERGSNS